MAAIELDDVDRRIVAILQEEGRISNLDLADRVGLSPTPCGRRVKRLEEAGVILGYRARVDPAALGLGVSVMVRVRLARQEPDGIAQFLDAVRRRPEITECLLTAGDVDYVLRVRMRDVDALREFIVNELTVLPAVADTQTTLILEACKPDAPLPTGAPAKPQRARRPRNRV
jgi:Lrp/AsnC family leucine-responsive transcriptional regulator